MDRRLCNGATKKEHKQHILAHQEETPLNGETAKKIDFRVISRSFCNLEEHFWGSIETALQKKGPPIFPAQRLQRNPEVSL